MTTIKSVKTKVYELTLTQSPTTHKYYVGFHKEGKEPVISNAMTDLNTASFVFDTKLFEAEGH